MNTDVIFLAPPLDELQRLALAAVDEWAAAALARPAPGMDAYKLAEAEKFRAGEPSRLIETEAAISGITADQQAARVIAAARANVDFELGRIEAKAAIRAASRHETVLAVLKNRGIPLHTGPSFGR